MRVLLFAGTSEGRAISEYLSGRGLRFSVCVATDYARGYLSEGVEVFSGRKGVPELKSLILDGNYTLVIDATHPYADVVTKNVKQACECLDVEYLRVLRESQPIDGVCVQVGSVGEAVEYLSHTTGNFLLTTGVKNLGDYTAIPDYRTRAFARVLDSPQSIEVCSSLGYENVILSSGACSVDTNLSHLGISHAKYLVTKESGSAGGFLEKVQACKLLGVVPIVVLRPKEPDGMSLQETIEYLDRTKEVHIVGIGMGDLGGLPIGSMEVIRNSDVLIGAKRMVDTFSYLSKDTLVSYNPEEVANYVDTCNHRRICILVSGDTGFYSGTTPISRRLESRHDVTIHSGISSVSYLASKVGVPWSGSRVLTTHGVRSNYVSAVDRYTDVFLITDGNVSKVCQDLTYYGLGDVTVVVGENMSYSDERVLHGTPKDFIGVEFSSLSTMYVHNPHAKAVARFGIPDGEYVRGNVPMTKAEVRAVSVSKCMVEDGSICWDVGAGTGSVSVELALLSPNGRVYAVERSHEGVGLIQQNCRRFRASNVETIEGNAESVVQGLESPDVVFIGGSGGHLTQILDVALAKNPNARIVLNCVTLDTLNLALEYVHSHTIERYEVTQVGITRTNRVGKYDMLKAENPVYVVSFGGKFSG